MYGWLVHPLCRAAEQSVDQAIRPLRGGFQLDRRRSTVRYADDVTICDSVIARRAAVAVVIADGDQGDEVLIILRATVEGDPWSGHLALPGGGSEPEDSSLEATARRETVEETGIDLSSSACIAELTTVTPNSVRLPSISISPFVFRYKGDKRITISHELADAWWIPIAELQRENAWSMMSVEVRDGSFITARGFQWRGHTLWGLTERILYEFLAWLPSAGSNEA